MPSKALPISPAVAQLLRDRREALGLTLRRVEELSGASGSPIPHSTLARIELGRFDPGVRRLGQLLALYQLPIQTAGDVLEVEALAGAVPMERDPAKLRDRAVEAWKQGKIGEALATFLAFRRRVPNDDAHRTMRHEAVLAFAVLAGSLGKLHLSRHMLDELLLENPEPRVLVPILVQMSTVWRSLGSPVVAGAFLESAAQHVRPNLPKQQGWVEHQRARMLIDRSEFASAARHLAAAVKLYRRAKVPQDEARAMLAMVKLEFERGKPKAGLVLARRTERFAAKHGCHREALSAVIDQARGLVETNSIDAGKQLLRKVLADARVADDNTLRFYAHYYLWQAERALGNVGRAGVEHREAAYYLRFVDQNSPESRAVREHMPGALRGAEPAPSRRARRRRNRPGKIKRASRA